MNNRYALVEDGIVTNIISLDSRNASDFPNAIKTADRPVAIGDTYTNGKFYRDGNEVLTALEIAQLESETYKTALQTLGVNTEEEVATDEVWYIRTSSNYTY